MYVRNGLDEETRDGYVVTVKQKKIWNIQMMLLDKLLQVCDKNHIRCFAVWGTLLGVVRHGGYIPWDDDLDIGFLREDFDKLCRVAANEFHEPLFFQTALTDKKYFMGYARLRHSDTTGIIVDNYDADYNNGIFIDIYPLDGICPTKWKRQIQYKMKDFYAFWARCYGERQEDKSIIKKALAKSIKAIQSFVSYEYVCGKHNEWCGKYSKSPLEVGMVYHRNLVKKYHFKYSAIGELKKGQFENLIIPIPADYEQILSSVYGDYMEFPPIQERGKWHEDQIIYEPDMGYKEYIRTRKEQGAE